MDNSIDEVFAEACDQIDVILHADGSASIVDNGSGIPVDMHPTEHRPAVEVVLTTLHAGGKFDSSSYRSPEACTAWASPAPTPSASGWLCR